MTEWRAISPLDLVRAGRWRRAAFFTYALSLSFFEGIVLPHLRRGGLREADIFSDISGVSGALSETGAREVGRAYAVHPVRAPDGLFHPKLTVLDGAGIHLLVGSGNLTFGGWGRNTETIEHLVPDAHAAAFSDAADFVEAIATEPGVTLADEGRLARWVDRLREASGGAREGDVRLLHSLEQGIANQLVEQAEALGSAHSLTVAAPYFGGPSAVRDLAERLSVAELDIHIPEALPAAGEVYPFAETPGAVSTSLDVLRTSAGTSMRPEHAKVIEINCRDGRLLVTGSANGSNRALGPRRNVELCVLRIQRGSTARLGRRSVTGPLPVSPPMPAAADGAAGGGLIYATLAHGLIAGTVFRRSADGPWGATLDLRGQRIDLGPVEVTGGRFSIQAPTDDLAVSTGRAIIIFERDEVLLRGFLIFTDLLALGRRLGSAAGSLLRFASGGGDDEDLGVILEWFAQNPDESLSPWRSNPERSSSEDRPPILVPVAELAVSTTDSGARSIGPALGPHQSNDSALDRLLARLRAGFAAANEDAHAALAEHEEREDADEEDERRPYAPTNRNRSLDAFDRLWDVLASRVPEEPEAELARLVELGSHVLIAKQAPLERIEHFIEDWTALAIQYLKAGQTSLDLEPVVVAFAAASVALGRSPARGRRRLLRLLGPARLGAAKEIADTLEPGAARQLLQVLAPAEAWDSAWDEISAVRGVYDDLMAIADALKSDLPIPAVHHLHDDAAMIELRRLDARGKRNLITLLEGPVESCPVHSQLLPAAERRQLRINGLARSDCCGRVLVNLEP